MTCSGCAISTRCRPGRCGSSSATRRRWRATTGRSTSSGSRGSCWPDMPTIVAMHHPPILMGLPWLDEIGLPAEEREALADLLRRSPQVLRVVAGHVHRASANTLGGCGVVTCASTNIAVRARLRHAGDGAGQRAAVIPGARAAGQRRADQPRAACVSHARSSSPCSSRRGRRVADRRALAVDAQRRVDHRQAVDLRDRLHAELLGVGERLVDAVDRARGDLRLAQHRQPVVRRVLAQHGLERLGELVGVAHARLVGREALVLGQRCEPQARRTAARRCARCRRR